VKNNYYFNRSLGNIYVKPSVKSEVSSQILYGEKFSIISKNEKWVKIKTSYDRYIGYLKNNKFIKNLKSLINKSYFKYLIISIAFLIWITFLDSNSLLIHDELNQEIKKLKNRKDALTDEINKDQELIEKLQNIDSLEHYGRENYNLKKENEDIFIIEYESDKE